MEINIPMTSKSFYPASAIPQIKDKLFAITNAYGSIISQVATLTGVNDEIITSVIFIESAGEVGTASTNAQKPIGLMQVSPTSASGIIFLMRKKGLLNDMLKAELIRQFGAETINKIFKWKYMNMPGYVANISSAALVRPAANILMGSMLLAVLIAEHTEQGTIRLDKVISRYNRGYFAKVKGSSIDQVLASVPVQTKAYILKLVGINSTMDILSA